MKNRDKQKIEHIIETRRQAHGYFFEKSPVYRSFAEMEKATYKDGVISRKQKELIAIGISIVINCESCMEWHIKQALDDGAVENEILEAIDVAIEMNGGAGTASARFAMNVIKFYS
jgi:AhpD family alkylhydroperoxidase